MEGIKEKEGEGDVEEAGNKKSCFRPEKRDVEPETPVNWETNSKKSFIL